MRLLFVLFSLSLFHQSVLAGTYATECPEEIRERVALKCRGEPYILCCNGELALTSCVEPDHMPMCRGRETQISETEMPDTSPRLGSPAEPSPGRSRDLLDHLKNLRNHIR